MVLNGCFVSAQNDPTFVLTAVQMDCCLKEDVGNEVG